MVRLLKLLNEWEIQLLVLFSFTLQVFLFFTGGLRQRTKNSVLRLLIWISYLGADFVAVYALGLLSRLEDTATGKNASRRTHQLAFFWTPFLLIHLGGQDTVTAFAIEDNSLWLRHLLNLVVQVNLALYAFWKSTSDHRTQLLLPSIFVFVTGIIKYGERTWALNWGNLKSITSSNVPVYVQRLGGSIVRDSCLYADIVFMALYSMRSVRFIFGDVTFYHDTFDAMGRHYVRPEMLPKFLEVELGLMYADIYTKAMVLRTKSVIILRSVSQVSIAVAFVLFCVSNKQRYDSVDVAITYVLFVGGFLLEVCPMSMGMVSPWTCAWLKDKNWDVLSRFILSKDLLFGWWRNRPLWSNSMGQYNLLNYMGQYDRQSSPWKRRLMTTIRKVANIVGAGSAIKLWVSKLLDAKIVKVDKEIKACVIQSVLQYKSDRASMRQQWLNLGPFIQKLLLIYLLALLPETLPVKGFETLLRLFVARYTTAKNLGTDNAILRQAMEQLEEWRMPEPQPFCTEAMLVEMKEAWVQLLIYAADRCPPQVHAAQLARGGELLTFVWLLAAHYQLRDTGIFRIELTNVQPDQTLLYALHLQQDRGAS